MIKRQARVTNDDENTDLKKKQKQKQRKYTPSCCLGAQKRLSATLCQTDIENIPAAIHHG